MNSWWNTSRCFFAPFFGCCQKWANQFKRLPRTWISHTLSRSCWNTQRHKDTLVTPFARIACFGPLIHHGRPLMRTQQVLVGVEWIRSMNRPSPGNRNREGWPSSVIWGLFFSDLLPWDSSPWKKRIPNPSKTLTFKETLPSPGSQWWHS